MMEALRFRQDGTFTILQMSDVQDLLWLRPAMRRMMEQACDKVKPDLIVYTGDNLLGNHVNDRRFFGKHRYTPAQQLEVIRKTLDKVFRIPELRGIPFAVIFGNHDDRNDVTKEQQCEIFRSYLCNRGNEVSEAPVGNYVLPVYGSDGKTKKLAIYMVDTARYDREKDECYESVTPEQVAWFRAEADQNRGVDAIMFLHIPLAEIRYFTKETDAFDGVKGAGGKYYCLDPDKAEGVLGEDVSPVSEENGFFDAIRACGDVRAIVSGHDHVNDFEGTLDGVRFIASPGCSFRSYGSDARGMPVFTFREDDPGAFTKRVVRYPELCGTDAGARLRYLLDADEKVPQKIALLGAAAVVGATAAGVGARQLMKIVRKRK